MVASDHSNKITLNANNQVMAVTGVGLTPMIIKYTAKGDPKASEATEPKSQRTTKHRPNYNTPV
jgi:hypothetical protein